MSHLAPEVQAIIDYPAEDRIELVRYSFWFPEARREAVLVTPEDLLTYPPCIRMPNLMILGESNSGKTTLADRFTRRYQVIDEDGGITAKVVMIEAPAQADEKRIYVAVLEKLYGTPSGWARTPSHLEYQAITLLKNTGTRILIVDEFQHFNAGRSPARDACMHAIKSLSNKLKMYILAQTRAAGLGAHTIT